MASTKTQQFADLLKGLNGKLEGSTAKLKAASDTASSKHSTYTKTVDAFKQSIEDRLDADKAQASFSAKIAIELNKANTKAQETFSAHQEGLDAIDQGLSVASINNNDFTGHTSDTFTNVADSIQ